jgi:hypothetical protein
MDPFANALNCNVESDDDAADAHAHDDRSVSDDDATAIVEANGMSQHDAAKQKGERMPASKSMQITGTRQLVATGRHAKRKPIPRRSKIKSRSTGGSRVGMHPVLVQMPTSKQPSKLHIVWINTDKKTRAIAVWPQYTVSWKGHDNIVGQTTWIHVSPKDAWLQQLTREIRKSKTDQLTRDAMWGVCHRLMQTFKDLIAKGRATMENDNDCTRKLEDSQSSSSSTSSKYRCARHPTDNTVSVEFDGRDVGTPRRTFEVTCINFCRTLIIQADENGIAWITGYLMPMLASIVVEKKPPKPCSQPAPDDIATLACGGFQLDPESTTTCQLRDKVTWIPTEHRWQVHAKKRGNNPSHFFPIDKNLAGSLYAAAKQEQFRCALEKWNSIDGSKRPRVPTETMLPQ